MILIYNWAKGEEGECIKSVGRWGFVRMTKIDHEMTAHGNKQSIFQSQGKSSIYSYEKKKETKRKRKGVFIFPTILQPDARTQCM